MKRHWKVGEIAKQTGLTVRTLRYYDQIGLFSPSEQTDSGHRLYNESDLSYLQQILSLKELGLSLKDIKSALTGKDYSPLEIVTIQMTRLKKNIKNQQKLLIELEHISRLMHMGEPLNSEDFIKLLGMMKISHQKYFSQRRMSWVHHLDRLGDYLADQSDKSK